MTLRILHGFHLLLARLWTVNVALLVDGLEVLQLTTDVVDDVAVIALELVQNLIVHAPEVLVVDVVLRTGPLGQFHDFTLQVQNAVLAGLHGVVAQVLRLPARVVLVRLAIAPPESRIVSHALFLKQRLQGTVVCLFVLGIEHGRVAPLDGPHVIVVDAWEYLVLRHAVFRLCHVVETGIVHDAGRMAVFLDPCLVAQLLDRYRTGGTEVVAQTKRVAYLVRRYEADELSHQFLVIVHLARSLVNRGGLHHIPVVNERHHIVVPADVALQNLASTRVADMRSIGIGDGRSQVADDGETGVLHRHHTVLALRPLQGVDGILEACLLKGFLPVVDTGNEVFAPLLGRGRVYVVDDRFDGLYQFATTHLLDILRTWLQAPATDKALCLDTLLSVVIAVEAVGEIAYARVVEAGLHQVGGEQHKREVDAERHPVGTACRGQSA